MSLIKYITLFSIFLIVNLTDSLYKIPIDIMGQNLFPMIPVYLKEYPAIPKLLSLDINSAQSWIFNPSLENIDDIKNKIIVKRGFYFISGNEKKGTIYLNQDIKIDNLEYLDVNHIFDEINNSGVLALNKKFDSNNLLNLIPFKDSEAKNNKYFGFCLDMTNYKANEAYLYIGDLKSLNNDFSKLSRFPVYVGDSEEDKIKNKSIWAIKLKGLFFSNTNSVKEKDNNDGNGSKNKVNLVDKKISKGLIIDESALIETIYNYIYVTKEAMLYLASHYFNDKKDICKREEIKSKDDSTYEIKYNCLRNKRQNLNNINLILENNITIELTSEDLLNCAVNKNIEPKNENNLDTCEFLIRYHNNINNYVLGLPILRKYKTYFLFNDNSILIENKDLSYNYLDEEQFSSISRKKKKSMGQTLKELFSTTLWISLIFGLLAGGFRLYDKAYEQSISESIINKNKYANL